MKIVLLGGVVRVEDLSGGENCSLHGGGKLNCLVPISVLEGNDRGIEQQKRFKRGMVARSNKVCGATEELPCPISVAVVKLNIGEVSVLAGDHAPLAELAVQGDALFVHNARLGVVMKHPITDRQQVDRHPLKPALARPPSHRARFSRQGDHVLEIPPAQRNPGQHAQRVDLVADVAAVPGLAQQLQGELLRMPGRPGTEGRERILVETISGT